MVCKYISINLSNEPLRTYGPSNWEERPEEQRSKEVEGRNPREQAVEIWRPHDLIREQVFHALETHEMGPDAIMGLGLKLSEIGLHGSKTESEESHKQINTLLKENEDLIRHVITLYNKIPREYVMGFRHQRLKDNPEDFGNDLLADLEFDNFQQEKGDRYLLSQIYDLLDIVATYFDAKRREAAN